MNKKEKIFAVVVTYNRLDLLKECLNSLTSQTVKPEKILVINNGSTDGTTEFLNFLIKKNELVEHIKLESNTGGSGGQYIGIKTAYEKGADWIWTMDDDAIPQKTALEELIKAKNFLNKNKIKPGFLSSNVFGISGDSMNVPQLNLLPKENSYNQWPKFLCEGIIPIKISTFVSLFIFREAIKKCGYPVKEFFIWDDDTDFTIRISKKFSCYLVGKSKILHKRKLEGPLNLFKETNKSRIKNFFYLFRNYSYTVRKENSLFMYLLFIGRSFKNGFFSLFQKEYPLLKSKAIFSGILKGIFFNPKKEYPKN